MIETAELRKRLCRTLDEAKRAAAARRRRAAAAEQDGARVLAEVVAPLFKTVASFLKAESYPFRVITPHEAVRLASETSGENFIELAVETTTDVPAIVGRVSRTWGRRILTNETVVAEATDIANLSDEDVLAFLLKALPPFVER